MLDDQQERAMEVEVGADDDVSAVTDAEVYSSSAFSTTEKSGEFSSTKESIITSRTSLKATASARLQGLSRLHFSKISNKLYGRDSETKLLQELLTKVKDEEAGSKQFVLISGEAGAGKSVLAESLRSSVPNAGGFYMTGKFDLQQQNEPYSAISMACVELIHEIMFTSSTAETKNRDNQDGATPSEILRDKLNAILDSNQIDVLANIIPNLVTVTGGDYLAGVASAGANEEDDQEQQDEQKQQDEDEQEQTPPTQSSSGNHYTEAKQVLHYAFQQFIRVICSLGPIILVLDDLQWSDTSSLELMQQLLVDRELSSNLMIVGSYRSNEVEETHVLKTTLRELQSILVEDEEKSDRGSINLEISEIPLGNLNVDQVNELLCDLMLSDSKICQPLAEVVTNKTKGVPFYVIFFLQMLQSEQLLSYSIAKLEWTWDVTEIQGRLSVTDNVADLMTRRMKQLPEGVCRLMPLVASLGASFQRPMLHMVVMHFSKKMDICSLDEFLQVCEAEGLIFATGIQQELIKWEHDKLQEAALGMADPAELALLRFQLGELLLAELSEGDLERNIFLVVQLFDAEKGQGETNKERNVKLGELQLKAGARAMKAAAAATAASHLGRGIGLRPDGHWESHPSLSLKLFTLAVQALCCVGQFDEMNVYCRQVIERNEIPLMSKKGVYTSLLYSLAAQGRAQDCLDESLGVLAKLDCNFPKFLRSQHILGSVVWAGMTAKKQLVKVKRLPLMTDERRIWSMQLLSTVQQVGNQCHSNLHELALLKAIKYTLNYGIADYSPPALAGIGMIVAAVFTEFETARLYGDFALELFKTKHISRESYPRVTFYTSYFVLIHSVDASACRKIALDGYQVGMKRGQSWDAVFNLLSYLDLGFYLSQNLQPLADDCRAYSQQMKDLKIDKIDRYLTCLWQLVLNIAGRSDDPAVLHGDALDHDDYMNWADETDSEQARFYYDRYQIAAFFWAGNYKKVLEMVEKTGAHKGFYAKINGGWFCMYPLYFQCALSLLLVYRETKKRVHKKMAMFFADQMNLWAKKGNPNIQHYVLLINAAAADVEGKNDAAEFGFKDAIVSAGRRGLANDQALANELLAEFYLRQSSPSDADYHFGQAFKLYNRWGAHSKCALLEERHMTMPGSSRPMDIDAPQIPISIDGNTG
ncbi:Transcriptional regulator [Seminavis robusta]|uniref:Transcriptional regulator n=1 Tax=Seminavis robusta TaxID=568900 RepID=A0A9N8ELW4_9STRA|nr:Transcriptional regulator [Seminavis robusta]|eukprot:Sro1146_g246340.1 Transcriptional regulator (1157) ;mRNA; r:30625-34328